MRITIKYDSCWQTRFLEDNYDTPICKRKFVATTKTKGDKPAPITDSTVLGVLCRLIGDQRKLYQAKESDNYYFSDLEDAISFKITEKIATDQELMYLTNKSEDRCGQSNFLGVLNDNNPWFFSDDAPLLWSVLFLEKEQLLDFIVKEKTILTSVCDCSPKSLIARINYITDIKSSHGSVFKTKEKMIDEKLVDVDKAKASVLAQKDKIVGCPPKTEKQKMRALGKLNELKNKLHDLNAELENIRADSDIEDFDNKLKHVIEMLSTRFPEPKVAGEEYCKGGSVYPYRVYSAALYLHAERLLAKGVNIEFVKTDKEEIKIQGFSKRGFNGVRDWLNKMTGGRKKAVGTPCVVQKQTGQLEIIINADKERGREIEKMIECAGVSSFYLGKKGLAYVSDIRV